jgi:hypothetical protein
MKVYLFVILFALTGNAFAQTTICRPSPNGTVICTTTQPPQLPGITNPIPMPPKPIICRPMPNGTVICH